MSLATKTIASPVGLLKLVASDRGLVAILWPNDKPNRVRLRDLTENPAHPTLLETERQLKQYFARTRRAFDLPLDMRGTAFQQNVWNALLQIPFGQTRSYGQLAHQLGSPRAFRAVGAANGRNPLSIIVPCHRVIGASGKLTGFAGGLEIKAHLLAHEARDTHPDSEALRPTSGNCTDSQSPPRHHEHLPEPSEARNVDAEAFPRLPNLSASVPNDRMMS